MCTWCLCVDLVACGCAYLLVLFTLKRAPPVLTSKNGCVWQEESIYSSPCDWRISLGTTTASFSPRRGRCQSPALGEAEPIPSRRERLLFIYSSGRGRSVASTFGLLGRGCYEPGNRKCGLKASLSVSGRVCRGGVCVGFLRSHALFSAAAQCYFVPLQDRMILPCTGPPRCVDPFTHRGVICVVSTVRPLCAVLLGVFVHTLVF